MYSTVKYVQRGPVFYYVEILLLVLITAVKFLFVFRGAGYPHHHNDTNINYFATAMKQESGAIMDASGTTMANVLEIKLIPILTVLHELLKAQKCVSVNYCMAHSSNTVHAVKLSHYY